MTIKREFIQFEVPADIEGRRYEWIDTDKTFDEALMEVAKPYGYRAMRVVVKTFNDETFKVTTRTIRHIYKRNGELWED